MKTKYKILTIIGIIFFSLGIDAFLIESNIIDVNTIHLQDTGNTMKIVFIADFQRRDSDPTFVQQAVNIINDMNPDLVLLGGDYVDKNRTELPSIEPLTDIKAKYGVYGILGNHDYNVYWLNRQGADIQLAQEIKQYLESNDTITILQNDVLRIQNITLFALDSYWSGLQDKSILEEETKMYRVVLTHNQNNLEINDDTADLYLFGHTHCGQVRLPIIGSIPKLIGFEGKYDYKYSFVDGSHVYTTCGLTPAPRFLNWPEITVINLS